MKRASVAESMPSFPNSRRARLREACSVPPILEQFRPDARGFDDEPQARNVRLDTKPGLAGLCSDNYGKGHWLGARLFQDVLVWNAFITAAGQQPPAAAR